MIDLNSLAVFARVVEATSFSEAARRLKMPISTVSRRVADLEDQLGVRLLERTTRNVRVTDIGAEVLEHAQRTTELSEAISNIVSYQLATVSGLLRLSAPPSISDSLLAPIVSAFQASYPDVRVQILIADRRVDHVVEGVDITFHVGSLKDSLLVAKRILTYRHLLVATPAYLQKFGDPESPRDLVNHRLLAFSFWKPENTWTFTRAGGTEMETVTFKPFVSINDFAGLTPILLANGGIGEVPPIVQPELLATGQLVEVMKGWRLKTYDLSMVHLGNRHMPRHVRLFKEVANQMAASLFPDLPK